MSDPIRLALIGSGIFARDAHVPAILALKDTFRVMAIFSRTEANATALAAQFPYAVDATADLESVLSRDDVDAVDILVPIPLLPDAVRHALDAGKHLISEKPIAPDTHIGRDLLAYAAHHEQQVWMVAENFRYEPTYVHAAELVRSGTIGQPAIVTWARQVGLTPGNPYYETRWRRSGAVAGGFILDAGVHFVAALRLILGEITQVSAITAAIRPDLPPIDTIHVALTFENGTSGVYSDTYARQSPWHTTLDIVGDKGGLRVGRGEIEVTVDGMTQHLQLPSPRGVEEELLAFAAAIRDGTPHRNTPEQALQDVAVIEAMLRSADTGQRVTVERFV